MATRSSSRGANSRRSESYARPPPTTDPDSHSSRFGGPRRSGDCRWTPCLDSDSRGSLNYSLAELAEVVARAHRDGWQIGVHANGDAAIDVTIDAFEQALTATPRHDDRPDARAPLRVPRVVASGQRRPGPPPRRQDRRVPADRSGTRRRHLHDSRRGVAAVRRTGRRATRLGRLRRAHRLSGRHREWQPSTSGVDLRRVSSRRCVDDRRDEERARRALRTPPPARATRPLRRNE